MLRLSSFATLTALTLFGATALADEPEQLPPPNIVVEPPATNAPPAKPKLDGPKAHVKVTTSATVYLQEFVEADNKWVDVCSAPCEADVVQSGRYRITGGAGVQRELVIDKPYVEVVFDPPNAGVKALGITGIVVGGITAFTGFIYLMVGLSHADFDCTYPQRSYHTTKAICERDRRTAPDKQLGGGIALGIGAVVTVAGIYAVVKNNKAAVTEKKSPDAASPPPQAFLREPTWRTTASSAESATPLPAVTFPFVYEGRF